MIQDETDGAAGGIVRPQNDRVEGFEVVHVAEAHPIEEQREPAGPSDEARQSFKFAASSDWVPDRLMERSAILSPLVSPWSTPSAKRSSPAVPEKAADPT